MNYPVFTYRSALSTTDNTLNIILEDYTTKITIDDPTALAHFLLAMDGKTDLTTLREKHQLDQALVDALVEKLEPAGMIRMTEQAAAKTIEPASFAKLCRKVFPIWKETVFTHEFWQSMTDGTRVQKQNLRVGYSKTFILSKGPPNASLWSPRQSTITRRSVIISQPTLSKNIITTFSL